jgi:hypothetical protein
VQDAVVDNRPNVLLEQRQRAPEAVGEAHPALHQ